MVVLPVPGPPVITVTPPKAAASTASRCFAPNSTPVSRSYRAMRFSAACGFMPAFFPAESSRRSRRAVSFFRLIQPGQVQGGNAVHFLPGQLPFHDQFRDGVGHGLFPGGQDLPAFPQQFTR